MPKPKSKGSQTDYDKWIEHQIQEGIENFATKLRVEIEDRISKLKTEITDLKSEVEILSDENVSLKKLCQGSEDTIEQLKKKVEDLEETNSYATSRLHSQLEEKDSFIRIMMEKIDQLEQGTKANNIKISGVKEEEGEDITAKVVDIVRDQLKVHNMNSDDIKDAGRMGKKTETNTRDILVKFKCSTIRDTTYKKRKLLMRNDDPIYINEDLTQCRSQLFYEARKLRKKGKLFGVWTQQGNIMVKLQQDDPPCAVRNFNQLKTLVQEYSDSENDQDDYSYQ